jgi:DNA-binding SARP family transcriptional activator
MSTTKVAPPPVEQGPAFKPYIAPDAVIPEFTWSAVALGAFGIEIDGQAAAARKESRKPLDLLKLLVAASPAGGGPVPIERLSAALWPEAEGDAARNSFDNTLFRLRKLLGADRHLLLQGGALRLATASCWTDLAELDVVLEALDAEPAPGRVGDAARSDGLLDLAERALALYRGPFLAGEDELPLVQAARARIDSRFTRQMARAGAALQAAGRMADAARLYARVVELQPLAEDIHRQLIACLLALGRRAEAFDAYRRCRQQLSVLLNLRPSPETEALIAPIRDL